MSVIPGKINRLLGKSYLHRNLTLGKLLSFAIINGVCSLIFLGIQVALVEKAGIHYLLAGLFAGSIGLLVKFILNSVTTYGRGK